MKLSVWPHVYGPSSVASRFQPRVSACQNYLNHNSRVYLTNTCFGSEDAVYGLIIEVLCWQDPN